MQNRLDIAGVHVLGAEHSGKQHQQFAGGAHLVGVLAGSGGNLLVWTDEDPARIRVVTNL
jgi:hypothetical protein